MTESWNAHNISFVVFCVLLLLRSQNEEISHGSHWKSTSAKDCGRVHIDGVYNICTYILKTDVIASFISFYLYLFRFKLFLFVLCVCVCARVANIEYTIARFPCIVAAMHMQWQSPQWMTVHPIQHHYFIIYVCFCCECVVFYVVGKPPTGKNYELIIYFVVAGAFKKFRRLLFHVIVVAHFIFVDLCRRRRCCCRTLFTKFSKMLKSNSRWGKQHLLPYMRPKIWRTEQQSANNALKWVESILPNFGHHQHGINSVRVY